MSFSVSKITSAFQNTNMTQLQNKPISTLSFLNFQLVCLRPCLTKYKWHHFKKRITEVDKRMIEDISKSHLNFFSGENMQGKAVLTIIKKSLFGRYFKDYMKIKHLSTLFHLLTKRALKEILGITKLGLHQPVHKTWHSKPELSKSDLAGCERQNVNETEVFRILSL